MDKSGKQILSAISYIFWPVAIVAFLIDEKDKDLKYHGAQGLTFGLAVTAVYLVLMIPMMMISYIIAFIGLGFMMYLIWMILNLLGLVALVIAILYAVKAYKGEKFKIPVIYGIMTKFYKG